MIHDSAIFCFSAASYRLDTVNKTSRHKSWNRMICTPGIKKPNTKPIIAGADEAIIEIFDRAAKLNLDEDIRYNPRAHADMI